MAPPGRKLNGEGSIGLHSDGRWMGRFYAWTAAGTRKRVTVHGTTRRQAADRLREAQQPGHSGTRQVLEAW
jgi:hypothetical protein